MKKRSLVVGLIAGAILFWMYDGSNDTAEVKEDIINKPMTEVIQDSYDAKPKMVDTVKQGETCDGYSKSNIAHISDLQGVSDIFISLVNDSNEFNEELMTVHLDNIEIELYSVRLIIEDIYDDELIEMYEEWSGYMYPAIDAMREYLETGIDPFLEEARNNIQMSNYLYTGLLSITETDCE